MLKKAGIIVAASAAGLLALSPLAFASETHDNGDGSGHSDSRGHDDKNQGQGGDRIDFTQVEADSHDCGNQNATVSGTANAQSPGGLLNLLGIAAQIPITANALNCNDILNDVNVLSVDTGDFEGRG